MYFRCTDCYAATWLHGIDASGASHTVRCRDCGRGFTVRSTPNLSPDPREQHEIAVALAEGNSLDLPSAYSVLLGIMTLEGALNLRDRGLPAHEVDPPAPELPQPSRSTSSTSSLPAVEYDPAFHEAVIHGYLSVQQAIERGSRDKYAKRLIERHALSEELAYLVADNKTSLSMALRKDREEVAEVLRPVKRAAWKNAFAAIVAGAAVVGVVLYGIHVWSGIEAQDRQVERLTSAVAEKAEMDRTAAQPEDQGDEQPAPTRRVRMLKAPDGRVLEIEGPDPSSILLAFCAQQEPADRYLPIELTEPVPPSPGAKLGIFSDRENPGQRYAIRIRRTIRGHRWVAGDGEHPIDATFAPDLPADAHRVPVVTSVPDRRTS